MSRGVGPALALAVLAAAPAAAGEPPRPAPPREALEALEAQLARAVDRVSLPHAARLLGRVEAARGYRLPGYGVVFVLTPRSLPGGEGRVYVLRSGGPRRLRAEARRPGPGPETGPPPEEAELEAIERQVLVLQHATESFRREAEEQMEQLVRDVRVRVAPSESEDVHVEVVSPPEAPAPPAPPGEPPVPEAPLPPAPPPWKFWFETGTPEEKREPAAVVADVRAALVDALAAQRSAVAGLGADERVTVTVDFVKGGVFAAQARPEKTIVLSARVKDLAERARGALSLEEFQRRVEVTEY